MKAHAANPPLAVVDRAFAAAKCGTGEHTICSPTFPGGRLHALPNDEESSGRTDEDRGTPKVSVIIVVAVTLYRDGIERALSQDPRIDLVGSTDSFAQAGAAIRALKPDIVLFDPATDPDFSLAASMADISPRSRMVALGVREVEADVLRCAEAGVAAYVPRDASIAELIAVIETAAKGGLRCSPGIAASLFRRVGRLADRRDDIQAALTQREGEVLELLEEGLSNKQIARQLLIGVSTVKNHVHNLRTKLNALGGPGAAGRSWRRGRRNRLSPR